MAFLDVGELFALTISGVSAVVITFLVQNYLNRPKVRGRIFTVMVSAWHNPPLNIHKTAYFVYVYLTNYHQNPIYLIDYEFEADFGQGYQKMERVYGEVDKVVPDPYVGKDASGGDFSIPHLRLNVLYEKNKPVKFGGFVHGFVMFAGDLTLHGKRIKRSRFTAIDVFGKRHTIEAQLKDYLNLNLLAEVLAKDTKGSSETKK